MSEKTVFETLSALDMTSKFKKKGNITYLPWSSAWEAVKLHYPDAECHPVKAADGCLYHTDGKTCWVETSMTIQGETQNEVLAVMDNRNQAIAADTVTAVAATRSLKRCFVKNAALFGLALNLWYGEELSDAAKETKAKKEKADAAAAKAKKEAEAKAAAALAESNAKIIELCQSKIASGVPQNDLYDVVKKYSGGKKNPNAISTIEDSEACFKEISAMQA